MLSLCYSSSWYGEVCGVCWGGGRTLTCDETKTCKGPTMAKKPIYLSALERGWDPKEHTLLTFVTRPSMTSPLKGLNTTAVYEVLNLAWPVDGSTLPSPIELMLITETIYLTISSTPIVALWKRRTHVYHYMYLRHLHIAFAWDNLQVELRNMKDEGGWYVWVASIFHTFEYRLKIEEEE
jgi:hypothetical protein